MKKHDHMTTLRVFSSGLDVVPAITSWYLSELGESKGKQELFTKQAPQRLKVLREHALIESAVSSNRIEGVTVDQQRIHTVVFGRAHLRDRDEEEVRGYRDALKLSKVPTAGMRGNMIPGPISIMFSLFSGTPIANLRRVWAR